MGNETKHTPGPWRTVAGLCVESQSGGEVVRVRPPAELNDATVGEAKANAALIAAAPELLSALERLLPMADARSRDNGDGEGSAYAQALAAARAALAKAASK